MIADDTFRNTGSAHNHVMSGKQRRAEQSEYFEQTC